jgi:hypothetical protein
VSPRRASQKTCWKRRSPRILATRGTGRPRPGTPVTGPGPRPCSRRSARWRSMFPVRRDHFSLGAGRRPDVRDPPDSRAPQPRPLAPPAYQWPRKAISGGFQNFKCSVTGMRSCLGAGAKPNTSRGVWDTDGVARDLESPDPRCRSGWLPDVIHNREPETGTTRVGCGPLGWPAVQVLVIATCNARHNRPLFTSPEELTRNNRHHPGRIQRAGRGYGVQHGWG